MKYTPATRVPTIDRGARNGIAVSKACHSGTAGIDITGKGSPKAKEKATALTRHLIIGI